MDAQDLAAVQPGNLLQLLYSSLAKSMTYHYQQWLVHCDICDQNLKLFAWQHELPPKCPVCANPTVLYEEHINRSAAVVPDEIPGGVEIRHLSDKPEKFYSRTDIKRACNERGWTWNGDTPKPYKVNWSGRRDGKS